VSTIVALPPPARLRIHERTAGRAALLTGQALLFAARRNPARLRRALAAIAGGARPASHAEAARAHAVITTLSLRCASGGHCLRTSVAIALYCRMHGNWPAWRSGIRFPPLAAHAWAEADGRPVGEPEALIATYTPTITVAARMKP
jgi:hypothetical protein